MVEHEAVRPDNSRLRLGEKEATEKDGADGVLVGFQRFEDAAKGEAMNVKDYFVKVLLERRSSRYSART
jgi:mycothione reductase